MCSLWGVKASLEKWRKQGWVEGEIEGDTESREAQLFLQGALLPGARDLTLFLSKMNSHDALGGRRSLGKLTLFSGGGTRESLVCSYFCIISRRWEMNAVAGGAI